MSHAVTSYYCKKCDFKGVFAMHWGPREYVLPNNSRVAMDWAMGWCEHCKRLAPVEIPSPDALTEVIRNTNPDFPALPQRLPCCLTCGSEDVISKLVANEVPWINHNVPSAAGFTHSGCGGEVWRMQDGFRIALRPSMKKYTIEGKFIEHEILDRL